MKTKTISQFKAHLSEILREVQLGERYIILDRSTPIAEVVQVEKSTINPRTPPSKKPFQLKPLSKIDFKGDVLDYLAQERGDT